LKYNVPIMNEGKGPFSSPDFCPDDLNRIAPYAGFLAMIIEIPWRERQMGIDVSCPPVQHRYRVQTREQS